MTANDSEQFVQLSRLADEFAERYRRGERPTIEEYVNRHPALADDIRDFFPAMAEMEQAKEDRDEVSEPKFTGPLPPLERLGDFRIIREIGHGGMGVVYEAEQVSLGRHVALKVLPRQVLADARTKRRFEREAKAAAKLHHTNIVPVFGVGEHDGLPYYVMQFIPGLGLDEVLEELQRLQPRAPGSTNGPGLTGGELRVSRKDVSAAAVAQSLMTGTLFPAVADGGRAPAVRVDATIDHTQSADPHSSDVEKPGDEAPTSVAGRLSDTFSVSSSSVVMPGTGRQSGKKRLNYFQSVAQIGVQVADALEYAHRQGIQHRDIKPSNLLLDTTGTVWVTDFGLAKADDSQNLTHTGDVLGTLRYMPPEAFDGHTDARGDVYSLGLTLFELLALRPAFDEKERKRLIKQVTSAEPTRLDRLNRDLPRDLVTIIHKAIQREPARRYSTAGEFKTDLLRFLDDEPILARRQTQIERYVRWARHNPGIALLGSVLTAVLVLATIASLLAADHFNRLRHSESQAAQNERAARHEAELSQQRAEESATSALAALKEADDQREIARQQRELTRQNLYYAQMHLALQAWREHRGLGHMRDLLNSWTPRGDLPDRRGWEWFYLNSLPFQNVRSFTESGGPGRPSTVAWHIATNRLAEGTSEGFIRIWDVDRAQVTLTLKVPGPRVTYFGSRWLEWSPDGCKLAAGCNDGSVHVMDADSDRTPTILRGHKSMVCGVAFSSDSKRVASWGLNGAVKIWEVDSGRMTVELTHPGNVSVGAWSPNSKLLALGHSDGTVTVSTTEAGAKIETVKAHADMIYHLAWSPDGTRFASTSMNDFFVNIWEAGSTKPVLGPLRHSHGITSMAWEPNGQKLATGSMDETVKIWNATTGHEDSKLRGFQSSVTALAWGPGDRLAAGGDDGSMRLLNAVRDQESNVLPDQVVRTTSVSWSPNGKRLASGSDDGKVRIWDPTRRTVVQTLDAHNKSRILPQFGLIRSLSWNPDGTLLATAGLDGAAKVWSVDSGTEVFALSADHGSVWSLTWSPDGSCFAAGAQDGSIRVVEGPFENPKISLIKAHEPRRMGSAGAHGARCLAWNPVGDRLASGGMDGQVKVWDPLRRIEVAHMTGQQGWIISVAWSPDGKRLACTTSTRLVIVWDAETDHKPIIMRGHNDFVDGVAWSPDGTRLASAGIDNSVRIWDPLTGEEAFALRGSSGMFHDVSWNSDGAQLAAASSDGHIWIWDATRGFERDLTARAWPFIEHKLSSGTADREDRLAFARIAYDQKRFTLAARLWSQILASDGKFGDDRHGQHRYDAARAAALAATDQSEDEPPLDDSTKAKLRRQAIDWLKVDVAGWAKRFANASPPDRDTLLISLNRWMYDPGLAGIRDTSAVANLSAGEQKAIAQFWVDVAAMLKTGNAQQATYLRKKLSEARKTVPTDNQEIAYVLAQLGRALLDQELWTEAEEVLVECLAIREKVAQDSWTTFNAMSLLGGALLGQKKYADAELLLLKGYHGMKDRRDSIPPIGMDRVLEAAQRLVQLYTATGKNDEAAKWRAELQRR